MKSVFLMGVISAFVLVSFLSGCTDSNGAAGSDETGVGAPKQFNGSENSSFHRRPPGDFNGSRDRNFSDANRILSEEFSNACLGKSEGDSCTVSTPRGNMTGTCTMREGRIFCASQMLNRT